MNRGLYSFDFFFSYHESPARHWKKNKQKTTTLRALPKTVKCDRSGMQFIKKEKNIYLPVHLIKRSRWRWNMYRWVKKQQQQQQQQQWKCRVYYCHCHFHNYTQKPPPPRSDGGRLCIEEPWRGLPMYGDNARAIARGHEKQNAINKSQRVSRRRRTRKKKYYCKPDKSFIFQICRQQINSDDNDWCTTQ